MPALSAKFKLDGNEFPVLSCSYSFGQGVNAQGQPSTDVQGGTISLQIAASDDSSIINWMVDPSGKKDGSIAFMGSDNSGGVLKEVKFEQGFCVGYSESFNASSSMPMTVSLNISAKKISVGDASLEKAWK
ncbi:MAG TPA: type VI secretion system tube protein TssD [Puia sp.]|jgi:hypothetical protein